VEKINGEEMSTKLKPRGATCPTLYVVPFYWKNIENFFCCIRFFCLVYSKVHCEGYIVKVTLWRLIFV